jgi:hypothetical protein
LGGNVIVDTAVAAAAGWGPWGIDTRSFAATFGAVADFVPDLTLGSLSFVNNTATVVDSSAPAYAAALARLTLIYRQHPWLATGDQASMPCGSLPLELTLSLEAFLVKMQLEPLRPLFVALAGEYGPFTQMTALEGLVYASPALQNLLTTPGAGFVMDPDTCLSLYANMTAFIGAANIIPTGSVTWVEAQRCGTTTTIYGRNTVDAPFALRCNHVVMADVQNAANMAPFNHPPEWRQLWSSVRTHQVLTGTFSGASTFLAPSLLAVADPQYAPYVSTITTVDGVQFVYSAAVPSGEAVDPAVVEAQITASTIFGNGSLFLSLFNSSEAPHFGYGEIIQRCSPWSRVQSIQGGCNIYYAGPLIAGDTTHQQWSQAANVMRAIARFPNYPSPSALPSGFFSPSASPTFTPLFPTASVTLLPTFSPLIPSSTPTAFPTISPLVPSVTSTPLFSPLIPSTTPTALPVML